MTPSQMEKKIRQLENKLENYKEIANFQKEAQKSAKLLKVLLAEYEKEGIPEEFALEMIRAGLRNS